MLYRITMAILQFDYPQDVLPTLKQFTDLRRILGVFVRGQLAVLRLVTRCDALAYAALVLLPNAALRCSDAAHSSVYAGLAALDLALAVGLPLKFGKRKLFDEAPRTLFLLSLLHVKLDLIFTRLLPYLAAKVRSLGRHGVAVRTGRRNNADDSLFSRLTDFVADFFGALSAHDALRLPRRPLATSGALRRRSAARADSQTRPRPVRARQLHPARRERLRTRRLPLRPLPPQRGAARALLRALPAAPRTPPPARVARQSAPKSDALRQLRARQPRRSRTANHRARRLAAGRTEPRAAPVAAEFQIAPRAARLPGRAGRTRAEQRATAHDALGRADGLCHARQRLPIPRVCALRAALRM